MVAGKSGQYFSQTLCPKEVVLVEDGALGDELESVIRFYKEKYDFTKVIKTMGWAVSRSSCCVSMRT